MIYLMLHVLGQILCNGDNDDKIELRSTYTRKEMKTTVLDILLLIRTI